MKKKSRTQLGKKGITFVVFMFVVLLGVILGIGYHLTSSPLMLELQTDSVIARYHHTEYSIPIHSIESVRLLEDLPNELTDATNGIIAKQQVQTKEYGTCNVLVSKDILFYLLITTKDSVYLFNASDDTTTLAIYDDIINRYL